MSRRLFALLLLASVFFPSHAALGQTPECLAIKGVFLAKKDDGGWTPLKVGAPVPKDRLVVSLFETRLQTKGDVEIKLRGDIGEFGPLPGFESAAIFKDNPKVDVDVTLERGIIAFYNKKKEGAAKVDLHVRGKTFNVTLREPGTKIGFDFYSRHAPGNAAREADDPVTFLLSICGAGEAEIHCNDETLVMKAPPGPAMLRWESHLQKCEVVRLEKQPEWLTPTKEEAKMYDEINEAAKILVEGPAGPLKLLFSPNAIERKVGLTAVGALGSPAPLFLALQKSKDADTRQFSIQVIRSWLGQGPGQIKKLEEAASKLGLSKTDTESLIHLLLGFDDDERANPATYQLLIHGLKHSKQIVRELSHWHLVRLAPAGKTIAYDATGTPEQLQAAIDRWRELIPDGKLPPKK